MELTPLADFEENKAIPRKPAQPEDPRDRQDRQDSARPQDGQEVPSVSDAQEVSSLAGSQQLPAARADSAELRVARADSAELRVAGSESSELRVVRPDSQELPVIDDAMDVESMSDEDLMRLCRDGDEGAFQVLFKRYEGPALSFIFRMIGDRSRTEALGQEAFLRIFKDAKGYQYPRSFTTWFYTIVRNLCKNELRWRSRHPTVSLEESVQAGDAKTSADSARIGDFLKADSTDPLESMVSREMAQKLEQALNDLPELEREILILSRFQHLKHREISEIVGVPTSTVRTRIYWTLDHLRKAIKEYL